MKFGKILKEKHYMEKHGILYRRNKQMEKETLKNKIKRIIPFRRIQRITGGRS